MTEITTVEIDGRILELQRQRNEALDRIVVYSGIINKLSEENKKLIEESANQRAAVKEVN